MPSHPVQVEEALVALGLAGNGLRRKQGVELLRQEQGILHHVLGGAGWTDTPVMSTMAVAALKFSYSMDPAAPPSTV